MNKFEDKDLSTPEHDELVLELLNPVNYMKFLKCIGYNPEWKIDSNLQYNIPDGIDKKCASSVIKDNFTLKLNELSKLPKDNRYKITTRTEVPVVTGNNNFIIGYVDVEFKLPFLYRRAIYLDNIINEYNIRVKGDFEHKNNSFKHIYPFLSESYVREDEVLYKTIKVEVKPYIKSFGETMRQLNTYRLHSMIVKDIHGCGNAEQYQTAEFVIFSPDTRFKAAFEAQGIKFVSPIDCLTPKFNTLWRKRVPQDPQESNVWDDLPFGDKDNIGIISKEEVAISKEVVIPDDWW